MFFSRIYQALTTESATNADSIDESEFVTKSLKEIDQMISEVSAHIATSEKNVSTAQGFRLFKLGGSTPKTESLISDQEMADSIFGRESNTAKNLKT